MGRKTRRPLIVGMAAALAALLLVWILAGVIPTVGVEQPVYRVTGKRDGYELRRYESRLEVEAQVAGEFEDALGRGFRILFRYISGENDATRKIPMTAPVLHRGPGGVQEETSAHRVAFVLPSRFRLGEAPAPRAPGIRLVRLPEHTAAAVRFSGYATQARTAQKLSELSAHLRRDGLRAVGPFRLAQYDPPWTPPFLRRNEILVPVH